MRSFELLKVDTHVSKWVAPREIKFLVPKFKIMGRFLLPKGGFMTKLSLLETEIGIKEIKDFFERSLAENLDLLRVSAPLFVTKESGINDNLNGVERPVGFDIRSIGKEVEIVQSLAKWKRVALKRYGFREGKGLYTDMNAIRRDEDLDAIHSVYVDQWDWERIIRKDERTIETLMDAVQKIYSAILATEQYIGASFAKLDFFLPEKIHFITSEDLLQQYPEKSPKEREHEITKQYGAVFIIGIGDELSDGKRHDGRSPDYDDWSLNGDILLWYPVLDRAIEISSMGIRVAEDSLLAQLKKVGCEERLKYPYHQDVLNQNLPYTIGGGIGQSRLCMMLLEKKHIGEVQASVWAEDTLEEKDLELL